MAKQRYALLAVLMAVPLCIQAEVYRSVDEQGNVTYTDTPAAGDSSSERIEFPPGPSEESIRDTEERNSAIRKAMEEAREERLEKQATREERLDKARMDMDKAEQELTRVKELSDDDRQTLVGGGSYIKPEYYERVKRAEDELEAAKKRFKEIRGY